MDYTGPLIFKGCAGCADTSSSHLNKVEILTVYGYKNINFCDDCLKYATESGMIRNANQ